MQRPLHRPRARRRGPILLGAALLAAGLGGPAAPAAALEDPYKAMTYQGELEHNGAPYTGLVKCRFMIVSGSTMLWSHDGTGSVNVPPSSTVTIDVTDGIFTVQLGDAPMQPILGNALYGNSLPALRVWVDGPGAEEQLPDQPIRGTPYAHLAHAARLSWGTFTAEGQIYSKSGGFKFPDGSVQTSAATGSGGSGDNTLDEAYDEGGAGAGRTILADAGEVRVEGPDGLFVEGAVGIGTDSPDAPLDLENPGGTAMHIRGDFYSIRGAFSQAILEDTGQLKLGNPLDASSNGSVALYRLGDLDPGVYLEGPTGTIQGTAVIADSLRSNDDGRITVRDRIEVEDGGGQSSVSLRTNGQMHVGQNPAYSGALYLYPSGASAHGAYLSATGNLNLRAGGQTVLQMTSALRTLRMYDSSNNTRILLDSNNGRVTMDQLEITGGADLAEPFEVAEGAELAAGTVLVIDESHPGRLRQSTRAYDSRVAGVVSGAGGVNAGITLKQRGVLEGGRNVALTGRVYVRADATAGAIAPGDLLTTAGRPGHAMKAADGARRGGAILGKAMTSLDEGTGLVLCLVSLQ